MKLKTTLSVAHTILKESKEPLEFHRLWQEINKIQKYGENEVADEMTRFYTNLMFDGRFVNLGNNVWDLRERVKHEDIALELKTVYVAIDSEKVREVDEEEDEDEDYEIDNDDFEEVEEVEIKEEDEDEEDIEELEIKEN